ncbi:MAG: peptidylprolyl isomerase [Bacteroidota bacterium]
MKIRVDLLLLAASAACFGSCRQEPTDETAVARIEDRTLTMQEIRTQFDTTRPPTEAQIQQYLRRWIADELLYREAVRRGLDQTPSVQRRLEDLRRQTVIQGLLESEIYDAPAIAPGEDDIRRYYEQNKESFLLAEPVVLVSFAVFEERPKATEFRNAVLRGTSWHQALRLPDHVGAVRGRADSLYFTEARLLPRELWRVATTIATGSPSFPVSTEDGFFVVNVWNVQRPGSSADLAYVRNEITNRLTVERRQRAYRSLVENLRSRYAVDIYLSPSFGDTTAISRIP